MPPSRLSSPQARAAFTKGEERARIREEPAILACDVGGTKTSVALLVERGDALEIVLRETYRSREHGSLEEIVAAFVGPRSPRLLAAGFGVAGPVIGGRAAITNLPWRIEARALADQLDLPTVVLLNDVEAHAWAVERLGEAQVATLQAGNAASGNVAVVAAGTGLGLAALVRAGATTVSLASEGGHADFAPRTEVQDGLLRALRARFGQVSVERVVSGPGLVHVYEFLRDTGGGGEPAWLATALREGDAAAAIARAASDGRSATCAEAVMLFLEAYGAEAGNWALRTLATGGVYLGGGIAAKLLGLAVGATTAWLDRSRATFLKGFHGAGRLRPLLEVVPVRVMLDAEAPLIGAAHCAVRSAAAPVANVSGEVEQT
jgi:glucokinase